MAIRFMQRNLGRPLTTGEIAAAAGTSERSLRRQFQRFTGQSPIAFHRHLRLEAARHALCDNHAKADITTAAGMHGFSHLSHFTVQYRRRYGELPSTTLRALRESPLAVDEWMSGEEVLRLLGRFEPLHLPLSSSRRPMRVLGPVVQISALSVLDAGK
jgi:AraC-like DNA-binding protein